MIDAVVLEADYAAGDVQHDEWLLQPVTFPRQLSVAIQSVLHQCAHLVILDS